MPGSVRNLLVATDRRPNSVFHKVGKSNKKLQLLVILIGKFIGHSLDDECMIWVQENDKEVPSLLALIIYNAKIGGDHALHFSVEDL